MPYRLQVNGQEREAEIVSRRPVLRVRIADVVYSVVAAAGPEGEFAVTIDGVPYRGWRYGAGEEVYVHLGGRTHRVRIVRRDARQVGAAAQHEVRASMPGVVIAVHCQPRQVIGAGDSLLTLESMKLQMTVVAPHAGTVEHVHVTPQAVFERGALLVSFARPEVHKT